MKKKLCMSLCALMLIMLLGGCGGQIPDMTEEQREAISEYAVELLLKYDTSQPNRLVDLSLLEEEATPAPEATEAPTEAPAPEPTIAPEATEAPEGMDPVVDTPMVPVGGEVTEAYDAVESTLLLPEHVTLEYCDYQTVNAYVDPQDAELVLDAEAGSKLLVVSFRLLNSGNASQNVDMLQDNIKYTVVVDETPVNGMVTLLSNDLTTYMGSLNPDESKDVVLLAEISEELLLKADTIAVQMSCGEMLSQVDLK